MFVNFFNMEEVPENLPFASEVKVGFSPYIEGVTGSQVSSFEMPICSYFGQPATPSLRFLCPLYLLSQDYFGVSSARSPNMGSWCPLHSLRQDIGICLPFVDPSVSCSDQTPGLDCHCACEMVKGLDVRSGQLSPQRLLLPFFACSYNPGFCFFTRCGRSWTSTAGFCQGGCYQSFSSEAVERISIAHWPSTSSVYEGKWQLFFSWQHAHHLFLEDTTPPFLADFFLWLF